MLRSIVAAWVLAGCWALQAAEPAVLAEAGEERVAGADADRVLGELKASFLKRPCVRAEIVSISNDPLLGEQKEDGELVLQMPQRFLRRFGPKGKPAVKAWILDGTAVRESNSAQDSVNELDFTKAPRKLALLKAALTMDAEVLKEYFHLALFKKAGAWRLVMMRKDSPDNPIDYKRIQARWSDGAAFFSEILRVPKTGEEDQAIERFGNIQVVEKFDAAVFKEPLLERKVNSKPLQD